ncbi:MAG: hypothetical protein V3V08_20300 [Nannocystaceae bacterium]
MTVDSDGYVWSCASGVARYDPAAKSWKVATVHADGWYAGCMAEAGPDGLLWVGDLRGNNVIGIDRHTLETAKVIAVPGAMGISMDFHG